MKTNRKLSETGIIKLYRRPLTENEILMSFGKIKCDICLIENTDIKKIGNKNVCGKCRKLPEQIDREIIDILTKNLD